MGRYGYLSVQLQETIDHYYEKAIRRDGLKIIVCIGLIVLKVWC